MGEGTYGLHDRLEELHWWFTGRREILSSELGRLGLPPSARILDVGCGTGGMLPFLSRLGEAHGADVSSEALSAAARRCPAPLHLAPLPFERPLEAGLFDLVTMFDLLEHLDDDAAALRSVRRHALRPEGRLVATVPALPSLWSRHDEVFRHRRRYTRESLRRAFEGAGFEVERMTFFNSVLFPLIYAVRRLGLGSRGEAGSDFTLPPRPLNWLLRRAFAAERHLLRAADLPIGVSLLVVARAAEAAR